MLITSRSSTVFYISELLLANTKLYIFILLALHEEGSSYTLPETNWEAIEREKDEALNNNFLRHWTLKWDLENFPTKHLI